MVNYFITHTFSLLILFEILFVEYTRMRIARIENSKPSRGRRASVAALTPKREMRPTPQAAQPGARTPMKIPIDPNIPIFSSEAFRIIVL